MPLDNAVAFPTTPGINLVDGGRQTVTDPTSGESFEAYVSTFVCERCLLELGDSKVDVALALLSGSSAATFRLAEDERYAKMLAVQHKCKAVE